MSILEGMLDSPSGDEDRNLPEYCSLLWKLTALWVIRCVFILPQRRPLSVVGPIGDKLGRDSFVRFVPNSSLCTASDCFFVFSDEPPYGTYAKNEIINFVRHTAHEAAVVGSIIFLTSVIFVAGKPLISACLRIIVSSFAR
jgi:hypothetical protein